MPTEKKFKPGQTVWVRATYRNKSEKGGTHLVYCDHITGAPGESWHSDDAIRDEVLVSAEDRFRAGVDYFIPKKYTSLRDERDALKATVARVEALAVEYETNEKYRTMPAAKKVAKRIRAALNPDPTALDLLDRIEEQCMNRSPTLTADIKALYKIILQG